MQEQNALNVQRGLEVAGIQSQNYDSQNDFNQGIFGIQSNNNNEHNNFNRGIYDTQSDFAASSNATNAQYGGGAQWGSIIGNIFN